MADSFYFYDLETSGINPARSRVMQFAGQRTDFDLKPISGPDNFLIKLTPDVLPDPEAILITGITPQQTLADGISEAEFLKYFHKNIATSGTVFVGFNSIRFDDEFIRYINYRNFYDAYEWHWQNDRGRWDILDLARMTRALRPDGIKWPVDSDGKPSNRLELLASINKLDHFKVHDAMSDVKATMSIAKLIKQKQPKLFDYLLNMRSKKEVEKLVLKPQAFVYSSGRYGAEFEKTTIAITLAPHPTQKGSVFVYDLRFDPAPYKDKKPKELAELMAKYKFEEGEQRLPIKQLQFNRCPAVAPLSVLDEASIKRLKLDMKKIQANTSALASMGDFADKIQEAAKINEKLRQVAFIVDVSDVDSQLYDGFFNDSDVNKMRIVRLADKNKLADLNLDFDDNRLEKLLLLYKARQYPQSLTEDEQKTWESYRVQKLLAGDQQSKLAEYFAKVDLLYQNAKNSQQKYLLEELKLYGESLIPQNT